MRHGLHLLEGRPHQLAGAVLDSLIDTVLEPLRLGPLDRDGASEMAADAVVEGLRLSAIGAATARDRTFEDVESILALMISENLPERDVLAELHPDLFEEPGKEDRRVRAMLRNGRGAPALLATGEYWSSYREIDNLACFGRLSALAADIATARGAKGMSCCSLLGVVMPHGFIQEPRDLVDLVSRKLRSDRSRVMERTSILASRKLALIEGKALDWANGRTVEGFYALVVVFDPATRADDAPAD